MLVVVGDAAQLGEGDLLRRRAGDFHDTVFDRQFGRLDFEIKRGELENLLAQLGRRAVDRADVVEMKIVAAVGRGHAPGGQIAVEGDAGAEFIRRRAEDVGGDLRGGRFMGLAAVGRT